MEKCKCRKLERQWQIYLCTSCLPVDLKAYVNQCKTVNVLIYQSKVEYWWNSSSLLINPVTVWKQHLNGSRWYFASHWPWSVCNVTESQLIQLIIAFCLLESPNDLALMSRIVTGLSHSLVSEYSLFLLVVPAHPLCHWTVAFPRALLWICYYTCFLLSHWWHKTIGWRHHNVSFHLYADNTLLYVSFESSILGDLSMARAHSTLESCAHDTNEWLLYINDGETEMLIIHAKDRPALLLDKL